VPVDGEQLSDATKSAIKVPAEMFPVTFADNLMLVFGVTVRIVVPAGMFGPTA
jgi:hypothetical protein